MTNKEQAVEGTLWEKDNVFIHCDKCNKKVQIMWIPLNGHRQLCGGDAKFEVTLRGMLEDYD